MANGIQGLFSTPEEIAQARIQEIRDRQRAVANAGGSVNQMLGRIAAGDQGMLRENLRRALGVTDPAEAKAAELQAMMQSIDPTNPDDLANIAKMMNELGYTKEAITVLERRNQVMSDAREEEKYKTEKAQGKTRNMYVDTVVPARYDTKGNLLSAARTQSRIITQTWDDEKQEWLPRLPANARPADEVGGKGYNVGWEEFFKEAPTSPAEANPAAPVQPTPSQNDQSGLDYSHWGY